MSWSQCRLSESLPDDGDPLTDDFRIHPCTDELMALVFVQADPDNPVVPPVGSYVVAQPLYGIWMYDPRDDTQRPIVVGEENFIYTEVVSADPKIAPPGILNGANMFALDPINRRRRRGGHSIFAASTISTVSAIVDIPTTWPIRR